MAFSTITGSFAARTSTGSQAVTGLSFLPKAIMFYLVKKTTDGTATHENIGIGVATSSSERGALGVFSDDAVGTSDTLRYTANGKCILLYSATVVYALIADFTSFDDNGGGDYGFTINVTTTDGTGYIVNYLAIGGDDLTNVKTLHFTSRNSGTGTQNVTGVGFQPDAIILLHDYIAALNTSTTAALLGIGYGVGAGEAHTSICSDNAQGTSNTFSTQEDTNILRHSTGWKADLIQMTADGFDLNWSAYNTTARNIVALCLKGGQYRLGVYNQGTDGNNQAISVTAGITGKALIVQSMCAAASANVVDNANLAFGTATGSSARGCVWVGDLDAQDTTVADQDLDRGALLKSMTAGTPTTEVECDFVSFDTSGFTTSYSAYDATARQVVYFMMGEVAAGGLSIIPIVMESYRRRRV